MRRNQKSNFQNAGVEKFLSLFGQWLCVVTPFAQLLENTYDTKPEPDKPRKTNFHVLV